MTLTIILNTNVTAPGLNGTQIVITGMGAQATFNLLQPIVDSAIQKIMFQYGTYSQDIQAILSELRGIMEGKNATDYQILTNRIFLEEILQSNQLITNALVSEVFGVQVDVGTISEGVEGLEKIVNLLSEGFQGKIQALIHALNETDMLNGYQYIANSLKQQGAQVFSFQTHIYLDGNLIDNFVGESVYEITYSQTNVHNEIRIESISEDLFLLGDPSVNSGTPRIEVQIGSRVMMFLLERRDGSGSKFELWGRDQTARESTPFATSTTLALTEQKSAKEVAEYVLVYSALDWEISDWVLPDTFEVEGTPLEVIQTIASEVGAIVRAQDDGSILVRKKYTVRPVNMPLVASDITYRDDIVIDFSHNKSIGDHYNSVVVSSQTPESQLPMIEVEELDDDLVRYRTTTSYVKVYWTDTDPDIQGTYVTDGSIVKILGPELDGLYHEERTEIIEFQEGVGETSYPIRDFDTITGVEWIGNSAVIVDYNKYGKAITLEDSDAYRIAKITYTTEFARYELTGHDVESLLTVFFFTEFPAINILVKTNPIAIDENGDLIDKQGSALETAYIMEESVAVLKGEAWIDSNKYDTFSHGFMTPYNENAIDGKVAWIDCDKIGMPGNYFVTGVTISVRGPVFANRLEILSWQV